MIVLEFPGMKPAAKARPRVTGNGTFMPHAYTAWKHSFAWAVWPLWVDYSGPTNETRKALTEPLSVAVEFRTASGNMRPDVDNAAGAVLDALQDAGVIANDSQVRRLLVEVIKAPRSGVGITVTITPL